MSDEDEKNDVLKHFEESVTSIDYRLVKEGS